jgi:hypothetical protein
MKMSENNPQAEVDPPIIVQGGGSIEMNVPPRFRERGSGVRGKQFKDDAGTLSRIQINENEPIILNPSDKITIYYK